MFKFSTPVVMVEKHYPLTVYEHVPLDPVLFVSFNQPIKQEALIGRMKITSLDGAKFTELMVFDNTKEEVPSYLQEHIRGAKPGYYMLVKCKKHLLHSTAYLWKIATLVQRDYVCFLHSLVRRRGKLNIV